jgi:hypothetical protein
MSVSEEAHVMLTEAVDWAGRFLSAYANLMEAERGGNEDGFAQAWGDLTTALLVLKDKVSQAEELLEAD